MSMSANHAMSVFTHSCLSTPQDPRTQLPYDRDTTTAHAPTSGTKPLQVSPVPHIQHPTTSPRNFQSPVLNSSDTHNSQKWTTKGQADVFQNSQANETELGVNRGNETTTSVNDYSTLFTTLLETNALLREEIHKLRQEHQKTCTTVERLYEQHQKVEAQQVAASLQDGHHLGGRITINDQEDLLEEDRLSQSLPARLLQNTWVQSSDQEDSLPASRSCSPSTSSSSQHCTHSSQQHSAHGKLTVRQESEPIGQGDEEEGEIETVEGSDAELQSDSSAHDLSAHGIHSSTYSLSSSSQSSVSSGGEEGDPFASPGVLAIEHMWDDFSVEDYALYERERGQETTGGTKEWSPQITIPEPFSMTLRESRTPKRKSRSMQAAERERMEREAQEAAELGKQFRATSVPASTYLPLYELLNAKNEQRRDYVKKLSKEILRSTEKPFSFMKREEEKKRLRAEAARHNQEFLDVQAHEKRLFRASPLKKQLFDPLINEQIREQEEYRRIRIKMRAEQLLASSKLPGSMQVKGREYTVGSLRREHLEKRQNSAFITQEHRFHPKVNNKVPDYDQEYLDFQMQLARAKRMKQTTTAKPFYLRTQLIPSRKEQVVQDLKEDEQMLPETRWPFVGPRLKISRKSPAHTHAPRTRSISTPYPAQMTNSFKLRQSSTQEKLTNMAEKEMAAVERLTERREHEDVLRRAVSEKSLSYDPTAWLEEKRKQKLEQFR